MKRGLVRSVYRIHGWLRIFKNRKLRRLLVVAVVIGIGYVAAQILGPGWLSSSVSDDQSSPAPVLTVVPRPGGTVTAPPSATAPLPTPLPVLEADGTCQGYFGESWTTQLQPAIESFATFPSQTWTADELLTRIQPALTPKYFDSTEASWRATTHPSYFTLTASVVSCVPKQHLNNLVMVTVGISTVSVNPAGNQTPDEQYYDVLINGQSLIADIEPFGSLVIPRGGGA